MPFLLPELTMLDISKKFIFMFLIHNKCMKKSNQKTEKNNDGSKTTSVFYPNKTLNQQNFKLTF